MNANTWATVRARGTATRAFAAALLMSSSCFDISLLNTEGKDPCLNKLLLNTFGSKTSGSGSLWFKVSGLCGAGTSGGLPSWPSILKPDTQQAFPSIGFGRRWLGEAQEGRQEAKGNVSSEKTLASFKISLTERGNVTCSWHFHFTEDTNKSLTKGSIRKTQTSGCPRLH